MSEGDLRNRIIGVARAMLEGHVDLLFGARQVAKLSRGLSEPDMSDPDVLTFVAIDSELDDVPMGSVRGLWASEALAERDRERDEYLGRTRASIEQACQLLIARFSAPST